LTLGAAPRSLNQTFVRGSSNGTEAPVTTRPREAELHRTATRLFRERGFHATSMQDLAEALGMNRGSLYHYIESKDDLLWAIVDDGFQTLEDRVLPLLDSEAPGTERLAAAIAAHLSVAAERRDELTLLHMERRALSPERRAEVIRRRDAYEAGFRRAIGDGVAAGELRPVDERLASIALLSICNWFTQWYRPDGPMTPDEIADVFTSLSFDGLRARGESSAPLPAPSGGGARRPRGAA
jgi:TetR/AcrR family transcriptional regulator, cholesterol catabolism regulator